MQTCAGVELGPSSVWQQLSDIEINALTTATNVSTRGSIAKRSQSQSRWSV
jgi:hypothetical protein